VNYHWEEGRKVALKDESQLRDLMRDVAPNLVAARLRGDQ
jgi:hypothetical protein